MDMSIYIISSQARCDFDRVHFFLPFLQLCYNETIGYISRIYAFNTDTVIVTR